jgi:hypothetical protein
MRDRLLRTDSNERHHCEPSGSNGGCDDVSIWRTPNRGKQKKVVRHRREVQRNGQPGVRALDDGGQGQNRGDEIDHRSDTEHVSPEQDRQGNLTTAALNKMSKAARNEADLAAAHKEFMAHYQALDAQMNAIRQMGTAARTGSDEYFKSWQAAVATIQNKDIRESAVERLNIAKDRYARVLSMADESRQKGSHS